MAWWDKVWDDVTGKTQARAATESARIQAEAGREAAAATAAATEQQRADLQPYSQFGQGFMDPTQQAVGYQQQLMNDPTSVMQNPMFQALQNQAQTNVMQNAAVAGRLGTGGTQQHLQDAALRTGFDVLGQERQANLANIGMLQGLVGMGQNAATGQAGFTGIGNQVQQGYMTDAAAAQGAGIVGAANASAAGTGNLLNMGATFIPGMGGMGDMLGKIGMPSFGGGLGGGAPNIQGVRGYQQ